MPSVVGLTAVCKMLHDADMDRQELGLVRDDPQQVRGPLQTADELAALLRVPVETVITWRYRGKGPPFLRIGRYIRYDPAEVRAWLDSRRNLPRGA